MVRLQEAINGPSAKDSPLFQLIPSFPAIDLPQAVADIFHDQVRIAGEFRDKLEQAVAKPSDEEGVAMLLEIQQNLGDLKTVQTDMLVRLMLTYRDVSAWGRMVTLVDGFPSSLKSNVIVRQQYALGLNRRNQPGDRDQALSILNRLLKEKGIDSETLGILGRVHKDRYKELKESGSIMRAKAALDEAINAYRKGFESAPRDYYPGVNAVTLLIEKGDVDSIKEAEWLAPLVKFAVARQGGETSSDYWILATLLELSVVSEDWKMAYLILPKVVAAAEATWKIKTTLDNLLLIKSAWERGGRNSAELEDIAAELQARFEELVG